MSGRSNRSGHRGRGRPGRGHAHANAHVEAAAAQQAEQQLLAAAFNPAPRHTYSSDDEEDEDFAEFKKQAAQLAGQAKPQPVLPEGLELSKFAAAVQQLQEHGISKEAATDALLASAEQHWQDYDTWLLQAQVFLALRQETDLEAAKMRQAMEASIQERDQRRQMEEQARPELTNLSEERLRKRFAGSAVLEKLTGLLPGGVLFCDNQPVFGLIKCPLVALLRLEERCCKWWPGQGTIQYFSTFADRCIKELYAKTRSSSTQTSLVIATSPATKSHQHQQSKGDESSHDVQQQHTAAVQADGIAVQDQLQQAMPSQQSQQQQQPQQQHPMLSQNNVVSADCARQSDARAQSEPVTYAASSKHHTQLDRATSVSSASAATAPADVAAAGDGKRRQSRQKRQLPERYRSASPPVQAASKPNSRKTPSPDAADVGFSCEARCKQPRLAAAACVGQQAATQPAVTGLTPLQQQVTPHYQAAACPAANGSGCSGAEASHMSAGLSPAAAARPAAGAAVSAQGPVRSGSSAQAALQLQLEQLSQVATGDSNRSLSLGYEATVVQHLSKLLQYECDTLQEMVYSFPSAAGSVPTVFKGDEAATADSDAEGSDVELVDEVVVPTAAASAAPQLAAANGEAGTSASAAMAAGAVAAAAATHQDSPAHSPAPRFQQHHDLYFQAGYFEHSPSVEIVSD